MGRGPTPLWGWPWATTVFREHHSFALNCASYSCPPIEKYFSHPYKNLSTQNSLILQYNDLQDIFRFSRKIILLSHKNILLSETTHLYSFKKIIRHLKLLIGALPAVMYTFFWFPFRRSTPLSESSVYAPACARTV